MNSRTKGRVAKYDAWFFSLLEWFFDDENSTSPKKTWIRTWPISLNWVYSSPPNHSRCFQFHERRNTMDHYRYWSPVPRHLAAKLQDVDRGKGEVFVWLPGQSTQTWDKCLYLIVLCARVRLFKFRKCDFDNHCWFANCRPGFTHRTSIFLLWSDHHDIVNIPTKSYSSEWSKLYIIYE